LDKGALLLLNIELIVPQHLEHFSQVSHMLLQGLTIDDNVIKINNNKAVRVRSKYLVHERENVTGELVRPKSITRNSHDP